jgi:hypothetical protein
VNLPPPALTPALTRKLAFAWMAFLSLMLAAYAAVILVPLGTERGRSSIPGWSTSSSRASGR